MNVCTPDLNSRRRIFWTTQPDACGTREDCGDDCGVAGLQLVTQDCGDKDCVGLLAQDLCPHSDCEKPRTFANNDWVRSLALNMLLTDARREDRICGWRPGALNGHWSESYMRSGEKPVGTSVRYASSKSSILDSVKEMKAYIQATMSKLVTYGVATSVSVEVAYRGGNKMSVDITIYGQSATSAKVGLTATRLKNAWSWQ